MRVDAISGQMAPYFNSGTLAAALVKAGVKADQANAIAGSPFVQFNEAETAILISNAGDLWYYDVVAATLKRLTNTRDEELEPDFSPDEPGFVRGNNLYVVDIAKANEKQLTRDGREGDKAIYNGYLDWIYEEELYGRGQKRGYWWSHDSTRIAFLRLDESPVPKFIIPDDVPIGQNVETTYYPKAGDPNPTVKLGIADVTKTSYFPNAGRIPKLWRTVAAIAVEVRRCGEICGSVGIQARRPFDRGCDVVKRQQCRDISGTESGADLP